MPKLPRKILIAFSGVDGSGKTTQAQSVVRVLEQARGVRSVAYSHGNQPWVRAESQKIGRTLGQARRPLLISLLVLKKDLLKLWLYAWRSRRPIVVFDRFVDDALAKFHFSHPGLRSLDHLTRWFAPRAECVFWLDVPPSVSFERDRDHALEYHERKRAVYREGFQSQDNSRMVRIDATRPVQLVQEEIQAVLKKHDLL